MGISALKDGGAPLTVLEDSGQAEGAFSGNVCGTYVHGIFDGEEAARAMLKLLCRRKGLSDEAVHAFDLNAYKERQYDLLADAVRENMDMGAVYRILEAGI